jgi:superfamily II DNA/RNA helicase
MPNLGMNMGKMSCGGAISAIGDLKSESGRAGSGTCTPEQSSGRGRMSVPPLTSAQLESASQKLRSLDDSDVRPARRTGWDIDDDDEEGRKDDKEENAETVASLTPMAPSKSSKSKHRSRPGGEKYSTAGGVNFSAGGSSSSSNPKTLKPSKDSRHQSNPRLHLRNGSRDDSFLSTISESTRSTDSTSTDRDSKINVPDGSQIEVYSENQVPGRRVQMDFMKDFHQMFKQFGEKDAETMQNLLRRESFDKPLEIQRRIIPLIMSAFQDEQKSFMTLQGAPQCGKTSALALGVLGAVHAEMPGIRIVVLSTGSVRDFKKVFEICAEVHPVKLTCFESSKRRVSFEGVDPDPGSNLGSVNLSEDMQKLSSDLGAGAPGVVFGHPSRVLPLMREAPAWNIDLSNVQVLALDDAEESIRNGLIDEVCEVSTILRHFSKQRLRHLVLSHFLSNEAKSMVRCLRTSLLRQQNLFGIRAHQTQARAKSVNHYYAVAPRARWPAMLAVLHHALSLPSGIIFDDESADARAHTRVALRALGVTASVWNALQEQRSGARAAARDGASNTPKGPAFHLMPSDLVVLKVDLPQVRCVLHFEVPRRELSIYGLRLMCLEQQDQKKAPKKGGLGGKSLSVLFVEEAEVVRELEKTFHIRMHEVPTEMLPS